MTEMTNKLFPLALNVRHANCHKAADAFWQYWKANGETHKHGYYESTWGAINQAVKMVGVSVWTYGGRVPLVVEQDESLPDGIAAVDGIPASAMRAANALLADMINRREWDVPCAATHMARYAETLLEAIGVRAASSIAKEGE